MLTSLPVTLLVAVILGFLAGLGVGGGSLLILWLTVVLELPQNDARFLNLLFFLPAAAISCLFRWKQGKLNIRTSVGAILAGCAAAFLFSLLSTRFDTTLLRKLFGGLLLFTGARELFYKPRDPYTNS